MKSFLFAILAIITLGTTAACTANTSEQAKQSSQTQTNQSMYTDLSVAEFKAKFEGNANAVILDVRAPQETAEGKIAGAIEINIFDSDFAAQIDKLDKSKEYFVYCRSGKRSANACQIMAGKGFAKLNNLNGGYMAWQIEED